MAQPIQDPTVGLSLQYLFKLTGRVRPALEEFVIPTVQVADIGQGAVPFVRRRASAVFNQSAVAGQFVQGRFEIPGGMLARIQEIRVFAASGSANVRFRFSGNAAETAAGATTAGKAFTDGRLLTGSPSGAQAPAGVLTHGTVAAGALSSTQYAGRVSTTLDLLISEPGWIIGTGRPGLVGFLEFESNTNNVGFGFSMMWDEFPIS